MNHREQLALIEDYLRRTYRPNISGFFSRIFARSRRYSYVISDLREYPGSQSLRSVVLWAAVRGPYLDRLDLPLGVSWGLFALNQNRCLKLSGMRPEDFVEFIKIEGGLFRLPIELAANLYCDSLLSTPALRYTPLVHRSDLERYFMPQHLTPVLDSEGKQELREAAKAAKRPHYLAGVTGETLVFYAITVRLSRSIAICKVAISPDNTIEEFPMTREIAWACHLRFNRASRRPLILQ